MNFSSGMLAPGSLLPRAQENMVSRSNGFVISLDFELHWGVRDHRTVEEYRDSLLGGRQAVPAILELFHRHGIHATWATVGFLFYEDIQTLEAGLPDVLPKYAHPILDPYADLSKIGKNESEDPFHFAPSLIRQIMKYEGQEIGTHTFSHFYVLAKGPTLESFQADLRSAKNAAALYGIDIKSIVFPRNQISRQHILICAEEGLIAYRGIDADPWVASESFLTGKVMRMANAYAGSSSYGCFMPYFNKELSMVNVPGSHFLRPWSKRLSWIEDIRIKRICRSMSMAARSGRSYHLWWHPHIFGLHLEENIACLTRIVEHYAELHRVTGWASLSMAEIAENTMRRENRYQSI